jgi:hypothetical protein
MQWWFRSRIRHPFFPGLSATPAAEAKGRCVALSGAYPELTKAALAGARPQRAVFALNLIHHPFLTGKERDSLWQIFQVPVYALLLDCNQRLLAYECEAQDGLHVPHNPSSVVASICECGRPGPRIYADAANNFSAASRLLPAGA